MVKGKPVDNIEPDHEDAYYREMGYQQALTIFEGGAGYPYGIMDELHDLEKWIEIIGEIVMKEENKFKEIVIKDKFQEIGIPSESLLENWHKKMFRPFSYKQILMGIHTTFNDGLLNFYDLLLREGRLNIQEEKKQNSLDILNKLKHLDLSLPKLMETIQGYNFIRNRVTHEGGYYNESMKYIESFKKLTKNRSDIKIEVLTNSHKNYTHRIKIIKSSLLKDYIKDIRNVFIGLLKGAQSLEYIE
jgi:hypothetical protein